MVEQFHTSETFAPDKLIAGGFPLHTREVTIASGQGVVPRGAVLGVVTATGKHVLSLAAAEDGSQTPDVILTTEVDATSADVKAIAYDSGDFVEAALALGTGHTVDSIRAGLRLKNIYLAKSA